MARGNALAQYRAKRRFDATPEPRGGKGKGNLYVIQKHDATRLHYDFRLELDGTLKSWAVTKGPSLDPSVKRLAVHVEDHPIDYAGFEGVIPEGNYGAGTVIVWDRGTWEPQGDPHQGLKDGKLAFILHGERLRGKWALVRMNPRPREKRDNWLLIKELDDEVDRDHDVLTDNSTSVVSGRDLDGVAAGKHAVWTSKPARKKSSATRAAPTPARRRRVKSAALPRFVTPQLATLVDSVPEGDDWLFEMKFDGYRLELAASGDEARLYTRSGQDWTERFAPLARAAAKLDLDGVLIDGEVVVLDKNGVSDFGLLQNALDGASEALSFFAFDLLAESGVDLRDKPLRQRKEKLRHLLGDAGREGPIFFSDAVEDSGAEMLKALCRKGYEGVIAKRAGDVYRSGRGNSWLKIKCGHEQEFVIVGHADSTKGRPFSSIALGLRENGKLRYAGKVGSGFGDEDLRSLSEKFEALARDTPAVVDVPRSLQRHIHWIEPKLVAQIAFAGFTRDNLVRHGRFLGLRQDKDAREVRREEPEPLTRSKKTAQARRKTVAKAVPQARRSKADDTIRGVRLSHPDKLVFPDAKATKRDLALYYDALADLMMPHVEGRLISLVRRPDGAAGETFFQRHVGATLPKVFRRVKFTGEDGKPREYMMISDASGLVAAAQFGVLEIHIWGSHADRPEKPDRIVFDFDPDEGIPFERVRQAAFDMRDVLAALGLESFPLVTGGKGVHVVVPIARRHGWDVVGGFAAGVADRLVEAEPDRFVATMSKAKRHGKIFIDHFRNGPYATAIAPYSSRAKSRASIACPVGWEELRALTRADPFTIADREALLARSDPWAGYFKVGQGLSAAAIRAAETSNKR